LIRGGVRFRGSFSLSPNHFADDLAARATTHKDSCVVKPGSEYHPSYFLRTPKARADKKQIPRCARDDTPLWWRQGDEPRSVPAIKPNDDLAAYAEQAHEVCGSCGADRRAGYYAYDVPALHQFFFQQALLGGFR
jgi:hypothetical protein